MRTATPHETFDHLLGSGAVNFSWWREVTITGAYTPEWKAVIVCENEHGGETIETVDHKTVLQAAREVLRERPAHSSDALVRECRNLIFDADEADLDAAVADELLQFIVLGSIVFG